MLSFEMERQCTSQSSSRVQRSIRANNPSTRGRYSRTRYPSRSISALIQSPHSFCFNTGTKSSAPERIKTSESSESRYCGSPLSVFLVIDGWERFHPIPNGPLPSPESYDKESCGENPDLPGVRAIGTDREPVPVTGFAENFSPMPRIAPPPFG